MVVASIVTTLNLTDSNNCLRIVDFSFDGGYPAGGEFIDASTLQLTSIIDIVFHNKAISNFLPVFINTTSKIALLIPSTGEESEAGAAGMVTIRGWVLGTKEA